MKLLFGNPIIIRKLKQKARLITSVCTGLISISILASSSFAATLENGWSITTGRSNPTVYVKDITQFGTLWDTVANRGNTNDHSGAMPAGTEWTTADFGGSYIFATTVDPRDGTIYAMTTQLYQIGTTGGARIYKLDKDTGASVLFATLPGNMGGSYLDIDIKHNQIFAIDMDTGIIHRINLAGTLIDSFDPLTADDGVANTLPALGDRLLGVAYNKTENRVYYSVWVDDTINNGNPNVVRSVGLNNLGEFEPTTDQLEISLTTIQPVGDIEFSKDGSSVLLAETGYNSTGPYASPHSAVLTEWTGGSGVWSQVGTNSRYEVGSISSGRNSRGGVAWAYHSATSPGSGIVGDEDFILVNVDAFALNQPTPPGNIYGYQYIPRTASPHTVANSIGADIDEDTIGQDKGVYGDVDILKYYYEPAVSISSYIWLDENNDGIQDDTEQGLGGVLVELFVDDGNGQFIPAVDQSGTSVPSQTTADNGLFFFNELPEGDYRIRATPPEGYDPSIVQNSSDNDAIENDSNIASEPVNGTFESGTFTLTVGGEPLESGDQNGDTQDYLDANGNMTVDFGFHAHIPQAEDIPTLSEWALLMLMMLLGFVGYRQTTLREGIKF